MGWRRESACHLLEILSYINKVQSALQSLISRFKSIYYPWTYSTHINDVFNITNFHVWLMSITTTLFTFAGPGGTRRYVDGTQRPKKFHSTNEEFRSATVMTAKGHRVHKKCAITFLQVGSNKLSLNLCTLLWMIGYKPVFVTKLQSLMYSRLFWHFE